MKIFLNQVVVLVDKYLDKSKGYLKYHVKSEDGTLDESIKIQELLVEDIQDCVEFLKETYGVELADKMFEVFVEFSLMQGLKFINRNRNWIIDIVSGDSNGN